MRTKGLLSDGAIAGILLLLFSNIAKIVLVLKLLPAPNGVRYPSRSILMRAGGRDETTQFDGSNLKLRKPLENAQTPTTPAPAYFAGVRVHAVLGAAMKVSMLTLDVVRNCA